MKKILFLLALLCFSFVSATSVDYFVYGNQVLVESVDVNLDIPGDVENPEVFNGDTKYVTKSYLDNVRHNYYFSVKTDYLSEEVSLTLPESAILVKDGFLFPEPDSIMSDGRSIILKWENYSSEQIVVSYEFVQSSTVLYWALAIMALLGIGISLFKKPKKKRRTENLFEDERKIVEYLLTKKNHGCWTKEIVKDLDMSKVKLSRKLRSLVQKEVIKKIPHGNENIIRLTR